MKGCLKFVVAVIIVGILFIAVLFNLSDSNTTTQITTGDDSTEVRSAATNKYTEKYAGAYDVVYTNINDGSAEAFVLREDGSAVWIYANSGGDTRKYGTWSASNASITIYIKGNTGVITERYRAKDGQMRHEQNYNQYLRKR